jgi:hypothetical protein
MRTTTSAAVASSDSQTGTGGGASGVGAGFRNHDLWLLSSSGACSGYISARLRAVVGDRGRSVSRYEDKRLALIKRRARYLRAVSYLGHVTGRQWTGEDVEVLITARSSER